MDQILGDERVARGFRVKFPEDVLQDNLAGQLWFGAEVRKINIKNMFKLHGHCHWTQSSNLGTELGTALTTKRKKNIINLLVRTKIFVVYIFKTFLLMPFVTTSLVFVTPLNNNIILLYSSA